MKTNLFVSVMVMSFFSLGEAVSQNIIEWPFARHLGGSRVRVDWRTRGELNNYGWTIERRVPADSTFRGLPNSFVPGHGTTNEPQSYFWIDEQAPVGRICYRLLQISLDDSVRYCGVACADVPTSVSPNREAESFSLLQNYPNPFNPTTTITYALGRRSSVSLRVFDVLGREVATLVDEVQGAARPNDEGGRGFKSVTFEASALASGVYFYRLQAGDFVQTRKLILVR